MRALAVATSHGREPRAARVGELQRKSSLFVLGSEFFATRDAALAASPGRRRLGPGMTTARDWNAAG